MCFRTRRAERAVRGTDRRRIRDAAAGAHRATRRAAFAGLVGTTVQYFGFFSYALASTLVFPSVFFPATSGAWARLISFSSIGVAFVVRPVGAVLFGHFGDRYGRRSVLVGSLSTMGAATFAIGLLPGFGTIGVLAPALLTALRVVQGAALGGEGMGATVLAVEHAPPKRRGLYAAFPGMGASLGTLLANGLFLTLSGRLTDEQFTSWGWRIPFLASIVLVAIGLFVRVSVPETPAFLVSAARDAVPRKPFVEVVRRQPYALALAAAAVIVGNVLYFVTQTFSLSYATTVLNVPRTTVLNAILVSVAVQAVTGFISSVFSDRLGRRRLCIFGAILCALWSVPLIRLLETGRPALITVGFSVAMLVYAVFSGPLSAYLAGVFETGYRFTAVALAFNAGVMVGGALAPIAADRLVALTGSVWSVSWLVLASAAVSLTALYRLREIHPGLLHDEPPGGGRAGG